MQKPKHYSLQEQDLLRKVGKRIRELRLAIGLSQEKLAFKCGLDRTYIGSVERGERNISVINVNKICTALNISIAELFNFDYE